MKTTTVVSLDTYRARRNAPSTLADGIEARAAGQGRPVGGCTRYDKLKDAFIQNLIKTNPDAPVYDMERACELAAMLLNCGTPFLRTLDIVLRFLADPHGHDHRASAHLSHCCLHIRTRLHSGCTQADYHRAVVHARRVLEGGGTISLALYHAIDQLPPWPAA
jgi:hypothetical protein